LRKDGGWSKIDVFPKSFMRLLAAKHIPFLKKRVKRGLDYKGRVFKPYDPEYVEYKTSRFRSKREGNKGRIKSMKGQRISSTRAHPPDLTVTGQMLNNLSRKKYSKRHFTIGWVGEAAEKVQYNKEMGRNIMDDIPNREKRFLIRLLGKAMEKQFKTKLRDINLTINT